VTEEVIKADLPSLRNQTEGNGFLVAMGAIAY